jgi:high-affinity iron transporter
MKRLEAAAYVVGLTAILGLSGVGGTKARANVDVSRPGATVAGQVRMPDLCSPAISPAVVYLEPIGSDAPAPAMPTSPPTAAEVSLINQQGLQFVPRIQAVGMGRTIRFANQDGETHNVHVVTPGFNFNQSMAPGQSRDYEPEKPGLFKLTCDVHIHMRGYVIVSPTPWFAVCTPAGNYRLDGVPDGRYTLVAWHEMGDAERREISVEGGKPVEPPPIVLTASPQLTVSGGPRVNQVIRPWADVIDRIGILLASSLAEASKPDGLAKARRLAEDAYWGEFESSDMETAVRKYLGFRRKGELERQFQEIRAMAREVAQHRQPAAEQADLNRKLLLALVATAGELNRKGVIDAAHLDLAGAGAGGLDPDLAAPGRADVAVLVQSLKRGFRRIQLLADQGEAEEAASEVTTIYTTEFEPIERYLLGREPQAVRPFEIRFNTLRGDLNAGLKGDELTSRVSSMQGDIESLVARLEVQPAGTFGAAFAASLITIVREGVEIILLLAMLIALVAKTTTANASAHRQGMRAIWLGVAAATVASLLTAGALNLLVSSAQGRSREILEGLVMLSAAGILFYVSYWMVSQVESKRWTDFLKKQTRRGIEAGGLGTLALTAFLAVYREGAEIALMYQALIGSQGELPAGLWGIAAGLGVGLAILAVVALIVRATSVRLPMRQFFGVSGLILFAMAIIFAGNGVFALQTAGIITTTNLNLLGQGIPLLGFHPNVQVVTTQGLILGGALLGWLLILVPRRNDRQDPPPAARGNEPIEQRELAGGIVKK